VARPSEFGAKVTGWHLPGERTLDARARGTAEPDGAVIREADEDAPIPPEASALHGHVGRDRK
jgi:hypothetical protein